MPTTESAGPFVGGGCRPDDGNDLVFENSCDITPTSWSLAEVGSSGSGGTGYGSGGVSASGPDFVLTGLGPSFTPEYYSYTGYLRLEVTCSDGSKQTIDSWTTIDGGPTRSFNHTYSNPCCNGKNNTSADTAKLIALFTTSKTAADRLKNANNLLFHLKKFLSAEAFAVFKNSLVARGAEFTNSFNTLTKLPEGAFYTNKTPPPFNITNGYHTMIMNALKKAAEAAGAAVKGAGNIIKSIPMIMPLPLMPGYNPATGKFDDGWTGACNDPGTLNPGVGTAILASTNGKNSINLANIYGPSMSPSLASNNHVINAFGGSPPTSFPVILTAKKG
jgi:hypothetical protein